MSERMRELLVSVKEGSNDPGMVEELEGLLTDSESWTELVDFYRIVGARADSPSEIISLHRNAAQVAEVYLDDRAMAVEILSDALVGDDESLVAVLREMRRLLISLEDWENYVDVAQNEVELESDVELKTEVLMEMGGVFETHLMDATNALTCFQAAFQQDSGCLKALWAARRLYRDEKDFDMVVQLLQLELDGVDEPERQAEILREMGSVYLHDLGQRDEAMECFKVVLELCPDDPLASDFIRSASTASDDTSDDSASSVGDPDVTGTTRSDEPDVAHSSDGQEQLISSDESSDGAESDAAVLAESDELAQVDEDEVDALSGDSDYADAGLEAGVHLGDEETSSDGGDSAVESFDASVDQAAEEGTSDSERGADSESESELDDDVEPDPEPGDASDEVASAVSTADDGADAVSEAASEDDSSAEHTVEIAAEDAGEVGPPELTDEEREAQIADLEAAAAEAEGGQRYELLIQAASLARGSDWSRLYQEALISNAGDVELYWRAGRPSEATDADIQAVAQRLDELSAEDEAATITAHRLVFGAAHLDEARTVDFKLRDLVKKTDDGGVIDWQIQRLIEAGKWRNVQQILSEQHGGEPSDARVFALRTMAQLATARLGDSTKAADFWRQVYQVDRSDVEARRALLIAYEALGKWKEYADILRLEVDEIPADAVADKLAGLRKLAQVISANLRQDALVISLYQQILDLDPEDQESVDALGQKYEKMRRWPDLVALLRTRLEALADEAKVPVALRIAHVYLGKMRNQMEAIRAFEEVLELDADSVEAMEALNGLYEKRRDWENFIDIRTRLAMIGPEEARLPALKELAEYANKKIRRPDLTRLLWEQILEFSADDLDAMRALAAIYEQIKDFDSMVDMVERIVSISEDTAEQVSLLQKAGGVYQDRLGDPIRSADAWRRLLDIDPTNRRAGDSYKKALVELNDWDTLTDFFLQADRASELVRILESQVGVQPDESVKIDLLFRAARVYRDTLDKTDRAVRAFERILQQDPTNIEAAAALEPIYVEGNDQRKLAGVLETILSAQDESMERASTMRRLAAITETALRNPMGAFDWNRSVLAERPDHVEARSDLLRLGEMTQQWGLVHESLVEALPGIGETEQHLEVLMHLGRILDEELGQPDDALGRYHEALSIDPDHLAALDAVQALYTQTGRWYDLLETLTKKIELADTVEVKTELIRSQALIYEDQLEDQAQAVDAHQALLALAPEDEESLAALQRLFSETQQGEDLHGILLRQLAIAEAAERGDRVISLRKQLADVLLRSLDQVSEAIDQLELIIQSEPEHFDAKLALEGLLENAEVQGRVALILEPVYVASNDYRSMARTLEIRLEEAEDIATSCAILRRLARLYAEHTENTQRAYDLYGMLFRLNPQEVDTFNEVCRLADVLDTWSETAQLVEDVLSDLEDGVRSQRLLTRLAGMYEHQLASPGMAVDAHRRTLEFEPGNANSIAALVRLFKSGEQWHELLDIRRRELDFIEDVSARTDIRFEMANVLEELLDDRAEAIEVLSEILQDEGAHDECLRQLARLLEAEERWEELVQTVHQQFETASGEKRLALMVTEAELRETRLGEGEAALALYREVLVEDGTNADVKRALERMLDDTGLRSQAANTLEQVYEALDDWSNLVRALEVQCEFGEDDENRALLHRIATLQLERGGSVEQAFTTLARAFQLVPDDTETLTQLESLAERGGLWRELADVYENQVDDISDSEKAASLHVRVGEILVVQLAELDRARLHYESALEVRSTDAAVLDPLESIYVRLEQWEALVGLLLRKVEHTEDLEVQKALVFRIAELFEDMIDDAEQAIEAYRMIQELDPADLDAINALERLYQGLERWPEYLDVLQQKQELCDDIESRKEVAFAIGQTFERHLSDPMGAVETYQKIVEWDETDLVALGALDRLYEGLEQWEELVECLKHQVILVDADEARIGLNYRIARIQEQHLVELDDALSGYAAILEESANHAETRQALTTMIREDRDASNALGILENIMEAEAQWQPLIGVWQDFLVVSDDLEIRSRVRTQIAATYEQRLADADSAFLAYGEAFREDPTDANALECLQRLARQLSLWTPFVELLEEQVEGIPSEYLARDLYLCMARVFDEELSDAASAIERYCRALELDPEHQNTILALDRLYQREERFPELADILRLRIEQAEPEDQIDLYMRLGAVLESALDEVDQAIACFSEVLTISPTHEEGVVALERMFSAGLEQVQIGELLEPIYEERGHSEKLRDLLVSLLAHCAPGDDTTRALHRLAVLSMESLEDAEGALGFYCQALAVFPGDEDARLEIARLAEETGDWDSLKTAYQGAIEQSNDPELQRGFSLDLAKVFRERLSDEAGAEQYYLHVVTHLDPNDAAALLGLSEIYERQENWVQLVDVLAVRIESTYDDEERALLLFRRGQLFEDRLDAAPDAIAQYQAVIELDNLHADALERLGVLYTQTDAWEPLYTVRESQVINAETDAERASLFSEMAQLAADHLDRPDDAIDHWVQVLELSGERIRPLIALEGLYATQESWRELADVCERQLALIEEDATRELELRTQLGRLYGEYLDRERNAIEQWQAVLLLDDESVPALWALRDLYDRTDSQADIVTTNERLLALIDPADEQCLMLWRQVAQLYQEVLERPEASIGAWSKVLTYAEHDVEAIDNLEELYTATENWSACVDVLERKAATTSDVYDRVSILFRVAEMCNEQLGDAEGGRRAYAAILESQPENLDAYEQLLVAYEEIEAWDELVGLLLGRLEYSEDAYEQVELYERTASIFETKVDNQEGAFHVLCQAFQATLDDERFGVELARLAEACDQWAPLIDTYQVVIEQLGMTAESVSLRLRVASWWDDKIGQSQHAATHYQQVLQIEEDNLIALNALEGLLERYESWDDAVGILRRKVELTHDPDERKAAYKKMAELYEVHLDRSDDAIEAYRQALMIDASDQPVLDSLERLYTLNMRWEDLIEILSQQAVVLTDDGAVCEKYLQIGELWESRLRSPDRAIDAYRQALALDESSLDALRALEGLFQQQERWYEMLDVQELMLSASSDAEARVQVMHRQAALQSQHLSDVESAIDTYRRIIGLRPDNADAVIAVETLYRQDERWEELVDVYELHLDAVEDADYQTSVRVMMADVLSGQIGDPARAVDVLQPILSDRPDEPEVLSRLALHYEALENWTEAIDMLSRDAASRSEPTEQLELYVKIGRIHQTYLGELERADEWFERALEIDQANLNVLTALKDVQCAKEEWESAVSTLQRMEAVASRLDDKSRWLFEIGKLYKTHLEQPTLAVDYCEQAMDLWPENVDAAQVLIDVYWGDEAWARAEPLLDLLIAQADDSDHALRQRLAFQLAKCAEQLQKMDKALQMYRMSYELDSTHLDTLHGMGNLLVSTGDWDRAFKIFQTLLVHHRSEFDEAMTAKIFHRQGFIKLQVGEKRKALDFFRKSLDLEPSNVESLTSVTEIHESRGDWEDVVHYRRRLIDQMPEGIERFQALVSLADVMGERLNNHRAAVELYESVLEGEPDNKLVLGKLLGLHEAASNWGAAIDTLTQLAELEENGTRKATYWCGIATIQQKYLDDKFMAVRSFDNALDADPNMLRAFEAIDHILTQERDYERQDRYYRKMLKRAMENQLDDGLIFSLARNLGEINRTRLQRYEEALKAFSIASARRPDDQATHQIMAQLYELNDDADNAIKRYQTLIQQDPKNVESYRNLKRLFMESERYDEAWCICQVLCFLNKANQDDKVFYEKHRSRTLTQASHPLLIEHWGLLADRRKSPLLDLLLQRLYPYAMSAMHQTPKELGINRRRDLINPGEQTPFNTVLNYVSQRMQIARPECFQDPNQRAGMHVVPLDPPAFTLGQDVIRGARMQELAFMAAKSLMLMAPQHVLSTIDSTYEQRKARIQGTIYTLAKLVNPNSNSQFDADLFELFRGAIEQDDLREFATLMTKMGEDPGVHLNVSSWLEGLEYSANRVAFLFSNDIVSAATVLKNEPTGFSRAEIQDRVRELVLFAVSEEYFALRKALGLSINELA